MRTIVNGLLLADGKVLLARRSPARKAYPGLWSFPGGHVEVGENLQEALVREMREELGIVPIVFEALDLIADPNAAATDPATYHMFGITRWQGKPIIRDNEHSELGWFQPEVAAGLLDLALEEYRPLLLGLGASAPR
jgi:8-oxo-dGTP diphosphatase